MSSAVTKAGPYFASGEIKWSSLRDTFRLGTPSDDGATPGSSTTGTISASELRRDADVTETNPIVPDATENASIETTNNWKVSQMRNSIKYYYITQTNTDTNYDIDALSWNSNLNKNILKWVSIDGIVGSNNNAASAADLNATAHNLTITVSGDIWGARGAGGDGSPISGEAGGNALTIASSGGNNIRVNVETGARIYGAGGGGEQGTTGTTGTDGICFDYEYKTVGSGCNYCGDCGAGWERYGGCSTAGQGLCDCYSSWGWTWCNGRYQTAALCRRHTYTTVSGGIGGNGGNGGPGRGYNNQSGSLAGSGGGAGTAWPGCPNPPYTGGVGTPGQPGDPGTAGGSGGEWGLAGVNTPASGNGGVAGKAVSGSNYSVVGVINNSTVRGAFNP